LAAAWTELDPTTQVQVVRTIEEAVAAVRAITKSRSGGGDVMAFVTGSLHLVGGFLEVLETLPNKDV
jgi:folylpolyglutamate synthase